MSVESLSGTDVDETAMVTEIAVADEIANVESDVEPKSKYHQLYFGIFVIVGIAISWTGATQFSKSSLDQPDFFAPFFLVWFSTNWMIFCYPVYYGVWIALKSVLFHSAPMSTGFQFDRLIYGSSGISLKSLAKYCLPFTLLWLVANYCYSLSLTHVTPSVTTVVFSSNSVFVYCLSLLVLNERLSPFKIVALIVSVGGICCVSVAEGLGSFTFIGVILALCSAFAAAVYKVYFKRVIGNATLGQVSLFMSFLGLCNLVIFWIVVVSLLVSDRESVKWYDAPWGFIVGSAILSLIYNLLINFGIAITYPLFVSIGLLLGIPMSAVIDWIWRNEEFKPLLLVGGILILISFVIMLVADFFDDFLRKTFKKKRETLRSQAHL